MRKLRIVDYIIILLVIVLACAGAFVVFKKKQFANLPVEKETTIQFDVFFRGITLSTPEMPFKAGDDAFITIRNVPYTKLKIVDTDAMERMTYVLTQKGPTVVPDVSMPNLVDCIVKLEDKAKKTPDGYVAGGNKIKMGIPVVIEGEKYKYQGSISNVYEVEEQQTEAPAENTTDEAEKTE